MNKGTNCKEKKYTTAGEQGYKVLTVAFGKREL